MDEAGRSARSAADQLGYAKPSLTADIYMGRRKRAAGAAEVLESRPALIGWPSIAASWTARDWILAPG
jgi:hypothetical protein